jgi:hypothetical protein
MIDKMNDNWEDWDVENIVIPVLHVPNKEQIKRLEERKKIEESEIDLMKVFFDTNANTNSNANTNTNSNANTNNNSNTNISNKETSKNIPKISKQKENELNQKEISIKLKQKKEAEKKHSDVFGEVIHDEYDEYDEYDKY